jgi:hypothetical protein
MSTTTTYLDAVAALTIATARVEAAESALNAFSIRARYADHDSAEYAPVAPVVAELYVAREARDEALRIARAVRSAEEQASFEASGLKFGEGSRY